MSSKHTLKEPRISQTKPHFFAAEKPAGLPTHPLSQSDQANLVDWLATYDPELKGVGGPKECGLVHRLDNETSGLCIVARTPEFYARLRENWNTPAVSKTYVALVLGILPQEGECKTPIGHNLSNSKKMQICDTPELEKQLKARPAFTTWKTKRRWHGKSGIYSLAEVKITTGVRHQIRTHLAALGHPLVGDPLYQNTAKRKLDQLGLKRHFLHLQLIEWDLEESKERLKSPLPPELLDCINRL